ncbi:sensor histidine kinase [Microbacterium fluvii]|uniref:histidine kinase n=1 Tax=Microbacterium fluvii TaxID=415215 RepID=A0ABW2HAB9_9MICO|nr:histidine kinase [Microbacterium fluvii]MCU4671004.1 histidine kinase [Microbacterium fluvii]
MTGDLDTALPRLHPSPPAWVGDLIAVLLIVAIAFAPFPDDDFRATTPLTWILVLLPAGLVVLRRRWPIPVLAACVGVYAALMLLGVVSLGAGLALAVAAFGAANRVPRRTGLIAIAVVEAVVIGVSVLVSLRGGFDPRTVQVALAIAFAAAAGDATRSRREYLQAVIDRARRAEETKDAEAHRRVSEERLRIARDLHDAVAHQISVISLNAGVASASLDARPEKTRESLATIRTASRAVLGEIGDLMAVLRAGDDTASGPAPQPTLAELDALTAAFAETGLEVALRVEGDLAAAPPSVSRVAYRVVQEGLTNALKHGADGRAHVLVHAGAHDLQVVVTNPVAAASAESGEARGGYGLVGLRERVASVRGVVETGLVPGGFRLAAEIPYPEEPR